jgi:hypothetical protein
MSEKKKRKKKRSAKELLAAKKKELKKLEERVRRKSIEQAIESGKLSEEKEKEFKALKRKVSVMRKAADIFEDADADDAVEQANKLANRFSKAMAVMVDEADEESEDEEGEEYEEEEEGEEEEEEEESDDDEYEED